MARLSRAEIFDPSEIVAVHTMARTNRRCFLMGDDQFTGKNFDHRKRWIEDKLKHLAANFGIDLLAFSCLSNHFHLALRSRPDAVKTWDDTEVARRWWSLCPQRKIKSEIDGTKNWVPVEPTEWDLNSIRNDPVKLAAVRSRLSDISWWMRLLCQYIALRANGEEGKGLGRFWQSRFKAVRILDEESLLACAAYVDLNPIRAALAETLEASDYTSVQRRITTLKENVATIHDSNASNSVTITNRADDFLSPISIDEKNDPLSSRPSRNGKRCSDKGFLALSEAEYLTILDWIARDTVAGKRGQTPVGAPPVFERLGIDAQEWSRMVKDFGRTFKNVAGKPTSIEQARSLKSRRRFYVSRV
jgi:REP element-mobilizing transposase RayT